MDRKKYLRGIIEAKFGGSQSAFARAIKRSPAQVHHWLAGHRSIGDAGARHIENTLGLPRGFFDGKNQDEYFGVESLYVANEKKEGYVTFSILNVEASAGSGCQQPILTEAINEITVLESWAKKAFNTDLSNVCLISARGTSMQGSIENGDVLFVDSSVRTYDGEGIYVICRNNEIQVKRLQKLHGNFLAIISDNKAYESERLSEDLAKDVIICGRVLASWTMRKFW